MSLLELAHGKQLPAAGNKVDESTDTEPNSKWAVISKHWHKGTDIVYSVEKRNVIPSIKNGQVNPSCSFTIEAFWCFTGERTP